jgi:hypothetical protein
VEERVFVKPATFKVFGWNKTEFTPEARSIFTMCQFDFSAHTIRLCPMGFGFVHFSCIVCSYLSVSFPFLFQFPFIGGFMTTSRSFPTWSPCFYLQSFPSWHISFIYSKHKPRDCNKKRYFIPYLGGKHYLLIYYIRHVQRNKMALGLGKVTLLFCMVSSMEEYSRAVTLCAYVPGVIVSNIGWVSERPRPVSP